VSDNILYLMDQSNDKCTKHKRNIKELQLTHDVEADKFGNMFDLNPRKWLNDSAEILLQKVIIKRLQMWLNDWITD